jgi:hypothetical protein
VAEEPVASEEEMAAAEPLPLVVEVVASAAVVEMAAEVAEVVEWGAEEEEVVEEVEGGEECVMRAHRRLL